MTTTVAVVPFGAVVGGDGDHERAGRWARQIARRLVDRYAGDAEIDLRPVFLVAVPERPTASREGAEAGYLVFGSTPDAALAAQYGRSLGAAYVLTGTYREEPTSRRIEVGLVEVGGERIAATYGEPIPPGGLHRVEPALASWLAGALGAAPPADQGAVANEAAYAALLEAMDAEVDATLLRTSDAQGSWAALTRAANAYAAAARADPSSELVEERILVLAATEMEHDLQRLVLPALETLAETRPRSWRVHYVLGEVRRTAGETASAIVAFEHADALHPLRGQDSLSLARLHIEAGSSATATSRLRRIVRASEDPAVTAAARRLLLGLRHPDLERALEAAGKAAVEEDAGRADEADAAFRRVLDVEPDLWEAHFGRGLLALQRGDAEAARAAFARAVELNPAASEVVADVRGERGVAGEQSPPATS